MKRLGGLLAAAFLVNAASAQEIVGKVKEIGGLKTSYSIANEQTVITTTAAESGNKYDAQLDGYIFPSLKKALQGMAFVSSVTQTSGVESTETQSWYDYDTKKRKSHAFMNLALQAPLTLLFEIEETYRVCKAPKAAPVSSYGEGSSSSTCTKQAEITVRGPVAVYGNYANSINVDALLRNKQELTFTLAKSYDNKDTTAVTRFQIKSVTFDESLARFFRIFNIPVFVSGGDVGFGNGLLDKVSPLTSRQRLMLGISRVARSANERILN